MGVSCPFRFPVIPVVKAVVVPVLPIKPVLHGKRRQSLRAARGAYRGDGDPGGSEAGDSWDVSVPAGPVPDPSPVGTPAAGGKA
jgi:hypothetical protein